LTSARFASSFLTLESDGALGLRVLARIVLLSRLRCPEVGLGFPSRRSSDGLSRSDFWTPDRRIHLRRMSGHRKPRIPILPLDTYKTTPRRVTGRTYTEAVRLRQTSGQGKPRILTRPLDNYFETMSAHGKDELQAGPSSVGPPKAQTRTDDGDGPIPIAEHVVAKMMNRRPSSRLGSIE